jgi:hypothetical protein
MVRERKLHGNKNNNQELTQIDLCQQWKDITWWSGQVVVIAKRKTRRRKGSDLVCFYLTINIYTKETSVLIFETLSSSKEVTHSVRLDPWHAGNYSVCFG